MSLQAQLDAARQEIARLQARLAAYEGPRRITATFEVSLHATAREGTFRVVAAWQRAHAYPVRREREATIDVEALRGAAKASYGRLLGEAVFQEGVRDLFAQAMASPEAVRTLLAVEAGALAELRWERIAAPVDGGTWVPLALHQRSPFSLHVPSAADRRVRPLARGALRSLVVVGSPPEGSRDPLPFDAVGARDAVLGGLGDGPPAVVLGPFSDAAGPASLTALCKQLTSAPFALLHITCHGRRGGPSREPALFLPDEPPSRGRWVGASEIVTALSEVGNARGLPSVVFLSCCESATTDDDGALGGLAGRIVREAGVAAVVAMTEPISQPTALALARAFYPRLADHGAVDLALAEALVDVRSRADVAVPALYSRLGGAALFADPGDDLAPDERAVGVERLRALMTARAPTLLAAFEALARADDVASRAEVARLCQDIAEIPFAALARGERPPSYHDACPFPGLGPFATSESHLLHGRAAVVESLLESLQGHPLALVAGPSGCGKSSLVNAGVVPSLARRVEALRSVFVAPGDDPEGALHRALGALGDAGESLLVVDPFEDLFTRCDAAARRRVVDRLLAHAAPRRRVVLVMRADFLDDCAALAPLQRAVEGRTTLLTPLSPEALRDALHAQATAAGMRFEAGLSELLLRDLGAEPGAMPLAQRCLRAVWERRQGRWLQVDAYRAVGGVLESLARAADDSLRAYLAAAPAGDGARAERRARDLFLRLTRVDTSAVRDTRQRVAVRDLVPAGEAEGPTRACLDAFAASHLVVVGAREGDLLDEAQIAHEALLRRWPTLAAWIEARRSLLALRASVAEAAAAWERAGRRDDALAHAGPRLLACEGAAREDDALFNAGERSYLDACARHRDRAVRQREARSATLVSRDLLPRDLTRALRLAWIARRLDPEGEVAATRQSAHDAWSAAVSRRACLYTATLPHAGAVAVARFDPAGERLATACSDGFTRLWDARGLLLAELPQGAPVRDVAFSPDGERVVSVGAQATAKLWTRDGRCLASLDGHLRGDYDTVTAVAWSPAGDRFVTVAHDRRVNLWRRDGTLLRTVTAHRHFVVGAAWSADGAHLVTRGYGQHCVSFLLRADGEVLAELGHDRGPTLYKDHWEWVVTAAAFSPDGKRLVTTSTDRTAKVWTARGALHRVVRAHEGRVYDVAFSPDGGWFVTCGEDGVARRWSPDGEALGELRLDGTPRAILRVAVSPDGRRVLCGALDGTVRAWSLDGAVAARFEGHGASIHGLDLSAGGRLVLTASDDRSARVWRADPLTARTFVVPEVSRGARCARGADGAVVLAVSDDLRLRCWSLTDGSLRWDQEAGGPFVQGTRRLYDLDVSADGRRAVTVSTNTEACLWDVATGRRLAAWSTGRETNNFGWAGALYARFSPEGDLVVTGDYTGRVRLWSLDGEKVFELPQPLAGAQPAVALGPGRALLAAGLGDGSVGLFDARTGAPVRVLAGPRDYARDLRFSRDGQRVLAASKDGSVWLWRVTGEVLATWSHAGEVNSACFSPDEREVVSASADLTARVWRVGGRPAEVLSGHGAWLASVCFTPDGDALVTASGDRTVRVWPTPRAITEALDGPLADLACPTRDDLADDGLDPELCGPIVDAVSPRTRR